MFVCFGVSVRMGNSLEQHRQVIGGFYSACKIKKSSANYWEPWEDEVDSWQVFEGNQIPNNCAEDNTPLLVAGKCWGKCHAPRAGKYF